MTRRRMENFHDAQPTVSANCIKHSRLSNRQAARCAKAFGPTEVSDQPLKQVGFLVRPALPGCRSKLRSYGLSPGVTSRGSHGRLVQNISAAMAAAIAAAFDIPVMGNTTNRALPLADVQRY